MTELLLFKIFRNHIHSAGVSDKDDIICEFFRAEVKVEHRAVAVDYKFRFCDSHIFRFINIYRY